MRQVVPNVLQAWIGTVKTINKALPLSSVASQLLHFSDPANLIVEHQEPNPFAVLGIQVCCNIDVYRSRALLAGFVRSDRIAALLNYCKASR